jgi:hypothetical protein
MRKLRLDLDALQVDTFGTESVRRKEYGTVRAHISALCTNTCDTVQDFTCADQNTCGGDTCGADYTCRFESCGACGTYYCATGDPSCDAFSCVYTCTCNPYDNC